MFRRGPPIRRRHARLTRVAACLLAAVGLAHRASALDVIGYSAAANDRFSSGYPSNPVTNTSGSFVGLAYSWLGVGWAASDPTKSFGFITPQHYLVARHYGGASTINLLSSGSQVFSVTQASVANTGYGFTNSNTQPADLSLGKLTAPIAPSRGLPRYGVLDLNSTSSSNSTTYNGQPLLVYGRGPDGTQSTRIGAATINGTVLSGSDAYITTNASNVILQYGDSGSPDFIPWTNPNGAAELTIIGNNAATDFATVNVFNQFASSSAMAAVGALTAPDGFALRVVGNPSNTWVGSASTSIGNRSAWGLSAPTPAPSDKYVIFSGSTAGNGRAVAVDSNANLRGLYFKASGSGTLGFTFSGSSTLTVGRGGITNYDASRQTISSALTLGDNQYWDVGAGGVTVGNVGTGTAGYLLEIAGSGTARITGTVSGAGGIALSGQQLELSGSGSFTGRTWVHNGTLSAAAGTLGSTSSITVNGGLLAAVNYNPAAPLTVATTGLAAISGAGLSLAAVTNANPAAAGVDFTASSGTITLASLSGTGGTRFGSHAAITAGVSAGAVTVVGRLTAPISGGTVTTGSLTSAAVSGGTTTVLGAASITSLTGGSTAIGGPAAITTMASGTLRLSGSSATIATLSGGRVVNAGAALAVSSGTFAGTLSGSEGSLAKTGPATLVLSASNGFSGPTSVQGGVLQLANANALSSSAVSVVAGGTLTLSPYLQTTLGGLAPNAGGLIDVGTGAVTVAGGLTAVDLVTAIVAGRNGGTWTGTSGITSSTAAAYDAQSILRAVGWVDNGGGSLTFAFAAPGDTNLDGVVDVLDTSNFLSAGKFDTGEAASWIQGDFNYDGIVDVLDASQFIATGLFDAGPYNLPPSASLAFGFSGVPVAVVPEPSATSLAAVGIAVAIALRKIVRGLPRS